MPKKNKKKWTTPVLTVLVRGNPEEGVLAGCKQCSPGATIVGPTANTNQCTQPQQPSGGCFGCVNCAPS